MAVLGLVLGPRERPKGRGAPGRKRAPGGGGLEK